jgi:anti-anti-sigma factor
VNESTSMNPIDVEQQRIITEREIILEVQRAMLPTGLPVLPDLSIAAEYQPADPPRPAGGDWFDVISMPDGALGLVVGDFVGHGPAAAAIMGQLRAIIAERLQRGTSLDETLRALDAFGTRLPGARGSTLCIVILDRESGTMRYTVRGHPPPMVAAADGTTRYLTRSAGPPLALHGNDFTLADDVLESGDTLVVYTDGAIERPGRTIAQGMVELSTRVSGVVRHADVAERSLAGLICSTISGGARHDDVSVVAATALSAPAALMTMAVTATPDRLAPVRRRLTGWLTELGASEDDTLALELSVIEAVTNSIEHAFPGPAGTVRVKATLGHTGTVIVVVSDDGRWKPPRRDPGFRGRGLIMMREFTDQITLDPSPTGTTVTLAKLLHHPVSTDGMAQTRRRPAERTDLEITSRMTANGIVLSIAGAVDSSNIDQLHASLVDAGRGVLPVTIVLDAVTLLTSAGLRTLYEHASGLLGAGRRVCLVAAEESPVRDVLAVSGLDRVVEVVPRMG